MRRALVISISAAILIAGFLAFLCLHGFQEHGHLCMSLSSNEPPKTENLVGATIPIDGASHAKITAVTSAPNLEGAIKYTIHVDLYTKKKQWLALESWSWPYLYLTSRKKVQEAISLAAGGGYRLSETSSDIELLP